MSKLSPLDKQAIIAAYVGGEGPTSIAQRLGVSRQWVSTIVNGFKRQRAGIEDFDIVNYRSRLKRKAVVAVEAGLDCDEDEYKRGNLGATVLKGLGEFSPDQVNQIDVLIANMPADMRAELDRGEIGYFPRDRSDFASDEEYRKWEDSNPDPDRGSDPMR
jgi:hypothetical protein